MNVTDFLVEQLNDNDGTWELIKIFKKPEMKPFINVKRFLGIFKYEELASGPYQNAAIQKRKTAVDYAKTLQGQVRVRAYDEQWTQLGAMTYDQTIWKNGEWLS